jgi:hypothetical protein
VQTAPAVDEGGNWIDVRYAPLSINDIDPVNAGEQNSDYHLLGTATAAIDGGDPSMGSRTNVNQDIDKEPGVVGTVDIGSDEVQ